MFPSDNRTRPPTRPTKPTITKGNTMNPETLTTTAELLTAIAKILPATALATAARRLPQTITWFLKTAKALHRLLTTPRGRHRQGRARHTK